MPNVRAQAHISLESISREWLSAEMYAHRRVLAWRGSRGEAAAERHEVKTQGGEASPCNPVGALLMLCSTLVFFFFSMFLIFKPPYISSSLRFTAKPSGKCTFPHSPSPATDTAPP